METAPGLEAIKQAENAPSEFDDYPRLAVPDTLRAQQTEAFLDGDIYAPTYDYRKLDTLYDEPDDTTKKKVDYKKTVAQEAVFTLEEAKGSGVISDEELELYADYHELRLKRIALIDNARRLGHSGSSSEQEVARQSFMELNEMLFGPLDVTLARGMFATEVARAQAFEPKDEASRAIKSELLGAFGTTEFNETEPELMSAEDLAKLHEFITTKYADVLATVPDTDDNVYYDANRCVEIMQRSLDVGGLGVEGWKAIVKEGNSRVATNIKDLTIAFPPSSRRTARDLRKLIVHEQEAHARRGQNGKDTGMKLLQNGTAASLDVGEGLGVLMGGALEGSFDSVSFRNARDNYITAGLALGADGLQRDARQSFSMLWRMLAIRDAKDGMIDSNGIKKAQEQAYSHVQNAFRGTNYAMPGIIYSKLKVYYEGLQKNASFFAARIDNLDAAFADVMIGEYNHTDPAETAKVKAILNDEKGRETV